MTIPIPIPMYFNSDSGHELNAALMLPTHLNISLIINIVLLR